ncbi:hypothetical protein [Mesorhizobium sp. M8A.F.Ca.ET.021.01.1.1]|uniref:hypothetical protein n=1 Tax=Mesorhizobium sp. M8A.F.Ca.ET.021.01.1.1 TaxID=2496757 RepID=UPI000FCB540A|nr:hypothetical protein [Mesorhizobium sp. M8A.F.Ca.ET.021.01.1.1]RUW56731.1 hypothetical protein EOA36_02790 [Mesorhizobium sp. M8A.F.Ca.ET.021.01.1.1]
MTTPTYAVKVADGRIIADLSWTNASEQVRLYGAEWVHDYDSVLAKAQEEAKKNSNTSGNVRKLTPVEEAKVNAPDFLAAAARAASEVAEAGSSELADLTREELFEIAAKMKLTIDKRTGHAKLVDTIEKARAEGAVATDVEAAPETPAEETPAVTEE